MLVEAPLSIRLVRLQSAFTISSKRVQIRDASFSLFLEARTLVHACTLN